MSFSPTTLADLRNKLRAHRTGVRVGEMIHHGYRLELYQAMRGQGALSADELAAATGLKPRWLLNYHTTYRFEPPAAEHLARANGFGQFRILPIDADPLNYFYEARL